jgi:hypothetical protein
MGLSFTIAADPRQRSHLQVQVPWDSWPHFTVSDLRLPQPGGPGPRIYILQGQGGPVIPPDTGFPFCHLLRLARLWSRYSTLLPHGKLLSTDFDSPDIASAQTHREHRFPQFLYCGMHNFCYADVVFTVPWSSNDHLYWLNYSSFQWTCHNILP